MALSLQVKNQHLLSRAGFGIAGIEISSLSKIKTKKLFEELVNNSNQNFEAFDVADISIKNLIMGVGEDTNMGTLKKNDLEQADRVKIREQSREDLKSLNYKWLDEMAQSKAVLREKMSFFWHGHFACRDVNIIYQQQLLQEIRFNALGNFKDLLFAVSKNASMLSFLNNQQNRKQKPNENFAREVLELFTMGRGNYTEKDIKEAARAFTGWGYNFKGEFTLRKQFHDDGEKTFLGQTGNFSGEDVLNIILQQKQTAIFLTQKMYKFFVNDQLDDKNIQWLANRFYKNNYNIGALLKDIYTSDWFYNDKNVGCKIKSPVELIVGLRKTLNIKMDEPQRQLVIQNALGQVLFYPPNVAGWPGGTNWIDSSTLMFRLQLPRIIKENEEISISTKADDDIEMGMMEKKKLKLAKNRFSGFNISASIDWKNYIAQFDNIQRPLLLEALKTAIVPKVGNKIKNEVIEKEADNSSRASYIKTVTIALMSSPEYQMC